MVLPLLFYNGDHSPVSPLSMTMAGFVCAGISFQAPKMHYWLDNNILSKSKDWMAVGMRWDAAALSACCKGRKRGQWCILGEMLPNIPQSNDIRIRWKSFYQTRENPFGQSLPTNYFPFPFPSKGLLILICQSVKLIRKMVPITCLEKSLKTYMCKYAVWSLHKFVDVLQRDQLQVTTKHWFVSLAFVNESKHEHPLKKFRFNREWPFIKFWFSNTKASALVSTYWN